MRAASALRIRRKVCAGPSGRSQLRLVGAEARSGVVGEWRPRDGSGLRGPFALILPAGWPILRLLPGAPTVLDKSGADVAQLAEQLICNQ